jgi:hypothetical protein
MAAIIAPIRRANLVRRNKKLGIPNILAEPLIRVQR